MASVPEYKIGYLMREKKCHKINPAVFSVICRDHGFSLERIDLERPLEEQGPFAVILNKLTDILLEADAGCEKSKQLVHNFQSYIRLHPETVVLDPPEKVRILLNRSHYYNMLQGSDLKMDRLFTAAFVELSSTNVAENLETLREAGVVFPFVCKATIAHGKNGAHDMQVVFNAEGVKDCRPPCVAQTFINHNAKLYKIFVIGKRYHVTQRPSLKNFYACDQPTIRFNSNDISKPKSKSHLTVLSPEDELEAETDSVTLHPDVVEHIVSTLRRKIGTDLMGVDVVVEKGTGRHAIIDINVFPGYEGFPNYLEVLMECILEKTATNAQKTSADIKEITGDDSGFDTGDSSDEKNKIASIHLNLNRCKKSLARFLARPEGNHHQLS